VANALPFRDDSFDLALCLEVLEHLSDPRSALNEMARVVRTRGHVLLSVPVDNIVWKAILRAWHAAKPLMKLKPKEREHVQVFTKQDLGRLGTTAGLKVRATRVAVFSIPVTGPMDIRTPRGELIEGLLRAIPLNNVGFTLRGRVLALGRQHMMILAQREV
jgi:SAM-dependent methyltransferase